MPVEARDEQRRSKRLREAITQLPRQQRLVVDLQILDELSFKNVAAVAPCSEDSAKASLHQGLSRKGVVGAVARGGGGARPPCRRRR